MLWALVPQQRNKVGNKITNILFSLSATAMFSVKNTRFSTTLVNLSIREVTFAPFLPKVRTSFGILLLRKTSFDSLFYAFSPVNTTSALPFGVENAPFLTLGANFRNFLTTLHLPIIYIIKYMEPLGAKFGNTQQAEVRTLCTFLPSSAKLRNISRPFYIHNSLLVRT